MPIAIGLGALTGVTLGVLDFTGSRLRGWTDRPEEEEFERKMRLRANRRRPIEETIAEIGEGRGEYPARRHFNYVTHLIHPPGIQPPGYEERRRERLQEKYGVEINPVKATVE